MLYYGLTAISASRIPDIMHLRCTN